MHMMTKYYFVIFGLLIVATSPSVAMAATTVVQDRTIQVTKIIDIHDSKNIDIWDNIQIPAGTYFGDAKWSEYWGGFTCLSSTDDRFGACPTILSWAQPNATIIKLRFTEERTQTVVSLELHGTRYTPVCGMLYSLTTGGACLGSVRNFFIKLPSSELAKIPFGGKWKAEVRFAARHWSYPIYPDKVDALWVTQVTLNVIDKAGATIYFPSGKKTVDLNLKRINSAQIAGLGSLDMCLYDGFSANSDYLAMIIQGADGLGFRVKRATSSVASPTNISEQDKDSIPYNVRMNYNGQDIRVESGVEFRLNEIRTAVTHKITLPGIQQPVLCVPTQLILNVMPFYTWRKSSGHYTGSLRIIMNVGTQTP